MYETLYITGGNYKDKKTRQLTYDEAEKLFADSQDIKTYNPICSMRILKDSEPFRTFIYFNFQVIAVDLCMGKEIWYEKIRDSEEYFINKIVRNKYNDEQAYIELHFRNRSFSDPNICMIKLKKHTDWDYYAADIEDTLFYRKIEFGETATVFKDLETNFEDYLHNIQKCDKRFIRKK